jgi:hypothetical protein
MYLAFLWLKLATNDEWLPCETGDGAESASILVIKTLKTTQKFLQKKKQCM